MPRSAGIAVENSFVKGLVSEATGLSFPENACTETFDCIFDKTGKVTRRKGFEYESSYSLFTLTAARANSAISTFLWLGAGSDGDSNFQVVQVGQYIYFYAVGDSLSAGKHATSIDLNSFDVSGSVNPFSYECHFAQGDGRLFVVGRFIEPFYVEYTPSTDTISSGTQIDIKIRDFKGEDDTYDVSERKTLTLGNVDNTLIDLQHVYNLWNQGWANDVKNTGNNAVNPITQWDTDRTDLPSNADRWWIFKNANDQYDTGRIDEETRDTSEVPKGHFVLDAFNQDRNAVTNSHGISIDTEYSLAGTFTQGNNSLTVDSTTERPTSVAFFANRVWYSGVDDTGFNTNLYFSQVLTDITRAGKCYQNNDPTSEDFSDLVATDGGVISIPEISNVVWMFASQNSLFIFTKNGIWAVEGSEGIGFTATDFSVQKVSSLQNVDNNSYVDLNGTPAWINSEGVWVLKEDQTLGSQSVTSVSKDSIQTWFEENISESSISFIKGTYNARERIVYWLFRSTSANDLDSRYEYDRCLCFNTETGAFYPWKLNTDNDIKVLGVVMSRGFSTVEEEVDVVDSGDTVVTDSLTADVTVDTTTTVAVSPTTKFLVENDSDQITFSEAYDTDYLDWTTAKGLGKDYTSYLITGYKLRGEGLRDWQTGYIRIHSLVEDNSSLRVQGVWDYYTSDGARWSTEQEGYKASTTASYTERKLKIRGNGLALQLRLASSEGKPFNVIGWASLDSVEQRP